MTLKSPTMMRCERCKAVISTAQVTDIIRHGAPCGVCGGTLTLCKPQRRARSDGDHDGEARSRTCAERRLIDVLREADGRPVAPQALAQAGIDDPASAIFELERAGYRIERAYADASTGRRFLGYRLRAGVDRRPGGARPGG
jgi:hypothetical protein